MTEYYALGKNKCLVETYTKKDFFIVTGSVLIQSNQMYVQENINYPSGLNQKNCIPISILTGNFYGEEFETQCGYGQLNIVLNLGAITLDLYAEAPKERKMKYKIVLMKT